MQKIISVGDLAAITIPEEFLEKIGIRIGDDIQVSIYGSTITIEPLTNSDKTKS